MALWRESWHLRLGFLGLERGDSAEHDCRIKAFFFGVFLFAQKAFGWDRYIRLLIAPLVEMSIDRLSSTDLTFLNP